MSLVAVYMWKSETLTAGDKVCLELATVLECLDSAFGTLMGPQLVEGINHVRSRQPAEGAWDEQSTMSGAHSSGTGAAASEVWITWYDPTLRRIAIALRKITAKYWSGTWVSLASSKNKSIGNSQDNDEAIDCELHSEENCSNRRVLMLSSKYCLGSCTQAWI
jgi:hypothetical protein